MCAVPVNLITNQNYEEKPASTIPSRVCSAAATLYVTNEQRNDRNRRYLSSRYAYAIVCLTVLKRAIEMCFGNRENPLNISIRVQTLHNLIRKKTREA